MSRRKKADKRIINPDPKYGNLLISKFMNYLMVDGKRTVASGIMYKALDTVKSKTKKDELEQFIELVDKVKPALEVRSRRVGGATYQVPTEVRPARREALAIRWIIEAARKRGEKTMAERLSGEFMDILAGNGASLKKKADVEKLNVPNEVMVYIATKIKSNIRELEGALIRIVAYSSLTNREITVDLATEALKDIISNKQNKNITIDLIQDVIAAYFNLRVEDLKSQRRTRNIAYPRQIAMYLSRKLTDMSLPKIGEEFGGRDHTTVIHAYEKISESLNKDESLEHTINDITKKLTQK